MREHAGVVPDAVLVRVERSRARGDVRGWDYCQEVLIGHECCFCGEGRGGRG